MGKDEETDIAVECSVLGVCFSFDVECSMFDLPAMPLGGLGRMSWCLGPVTMIMPPSFVMHGRRVLDVHLSKQPKPHSTNPPIPQSSNQPIPQSTNLMAQHLLKPDIDFQINNFTALSVEIFDDVQLSTTYSDFSF